MSRPTEDIIEDMDAAEVGRCGCLLPSDKVTEDAETDEPEE